MKADKRTRESDDTENVATKRKRKGSSVAEAAKASKVGESSGVDAREKRGERGSNVEGDASGGRKRRKSTVADPADASQSKEQVRTYISPFTLSHGPMSR